jgi:hypothetical protein
MLLSSCIKVAGKHYSLNRKTVSKIQCEPANGTEPPNLVVIVSNFKSLPLPGSLITLKGSTKEQDVTRMKKNVSEAVFSLTPGKWEMSVDLEGFNNHQQIIVMKKYESCRIDVYLGDTMAEAFE